MSDNESDTTRKETSKKTEGKVENKTSQEHKAASSKESEEKNPKANISDIKGKKKEEDPLAQLRNDYLYLRAEFDNYKRNNMKERSELIKYGGERLASDLLSILDVFEKALSSEITPENYKSFVDGVSLTAKELKGALEKNGIKEIDAKDKKFDPTFHEALTQVPNEELPNETVIEVFRKGYKFHDRVLRPAQVVVSKGSKD